MLPRSAGILLHPTALPNRFPVGDLGPAALELLDWAATAGQAAWQMLPLTPPHSSQSPYSSRSAFALSPLLISPETLVGDGLLRQQDLDGFAAEPSDQVDFAAAISGKAHLLRRAWEALQNGDHAALRDQAQAFAESSEQVGWIEDWALYEALRERFAGLPWWSWPEDLARRHEDALEQARRELATEIRYHCFLQFLAHRDWRRLREHAESRGIELMGDLPIYVAADSADVWAHSDLFELGDDRRPLAVAGVPPDAFSADGQLWGNPLYRWSRMAEDGYAWWVERLRAQTRLFHRLRLDHFRGFQAYWRVPAEAATAAQGEWVEGPGRALFDAFADRLGSLPLVAEDLGVITDEVEALRAAVALPTMKVLHFAFDDAGRDHRPHRLAPQTVLYTGTHDNDTTQGWFRGLDEATRRRVLAYAGGEGEAIHRDLIRLAYASPAALAVVPAQDVLGLGSEARFNLPGQAEGHWRWRLRPGQLDIPLAQWLAELATVTERRAAP